jgi:hypothetical protein
MPIVALVAMALTIAAGLILDANGVVLGVPLPPFVGGFGVKADPLLVLSVVVFAAAVAVAPRLLDLRARSFLLATFALTLALRLVLAAGREGIGAWTEVFDLDRSFEAKNEYLPGLRALVHGAHFFLDHFAQLVPALPVHAAGHPPGLLLTLHALGISTPAGMAALCILGGAAAIPLTYAAGRAVIGEERARVAALLAAFSPAMLLFGATSADALFATLGLLAAWPLAVAGTPRAQPGLRPLLIGAVALAVVSFFAWSLLAVGAWAVLLAWRRAGRAGALILAAVCGAALLAFHVLLHLATGFDPIGTFEATERVYRLGVASVRPYAYWLFGSPAAFLFVLGLPIAFLALRGARSDAAVAILGVLLVAAVAGFTKAETERIWLPFAPLLCLAAATVLPRRLLGPVLGALALQALLTELLWDTVW